jgi:uncharacterized protein YecE (DUF72 family)
MSMLRFGTCSWKYPSWKGLVYSDANGINYLEEYARRYRSVEVDQWFWSLFDTDSITLPKTETVADYLSSVDDDFRFTIKAPNSVTLTHMLRRRTERSSAPNPYFLSPQLFADFLARIEPMRPVTGCVILQFEYLNKQKMSGVDEFCDRIDAFLSALPDYDDPWPLGIELRNPNYLTDAYFTTIGRHGVPHVYCQGYYMPPARDVYHRAKSALAERMPGPAVIRLLGPDRSRIEAVTGRRWDRIVAPKDDELPQVVDMVTEMLRRGIDVYVNVNNHYEGSAPLTIEKLERLVGTHIGNTV